MPQINISEIREVNVHLANVLKELGSIQFIFCLKLIKTYVDSKLSFRELNKEFGDFSFLKNQYLCDRPKWTQFFEDLFICQFEDDSLVDTDQKNSAWVFSVRFPITKPCVRGTSTHLNL